MIVKMKVGKRSRERMVGGKRGSEKEDRTKG